jgi:hypothetical protein
MDAGVHGPTSRAEKRSGSARSSAFVEGPVAWDDAVDRQARQFPALCTLVTSGTAASRMLRDASE